MKLKIPGFIIFREFYMIKFIINYGTTGPTQLGPALKVIFTIVN